MGCGSVETEGEGLEPPRACAQRFSSSRLSLALNPIPLRRVTNPGPGFASFRVRLRLLRSRYAQNLPIHATRAESLLHAPGWAQPPFPQCCSSPGDAVGTGMAVPSPEGPVFSASRSGSVQYTTLVCPSWRGALLVVNVKTASGARYAPRIQRFTVTEDLAQRLVPFCLRESVRRHSTGSPSGGHGPAATDDRSARTAQPDSGRPSEHIKE